MQLHRDQGLELVGISLDENAAALADFLDKHDLPWVQLSGKEVTKLADDYSVRGIPALFLVDRDGKILAQGRQVSQLKSQLLELLERPSP